MSTEASEDPRRAPRPSASGARPSNAARWRSEALPPTLAVFAGDAFARLVLPRFRPGTRERYERLLHQEHLLETIGARRIGEVGALEFRTLEASVRGRGVDPRPHLALLRTMLREALELEVIDRMPRLPRLPPKPKKLPAAPSPEVVEQVLAGSRGWLRTAIDLAYFANARNGEVHAMRVHDVDLRGSVVGIRLAFSHTSVTTPKSGGERPVPMAERLRAILAEAVVGKRAEERLVTEGGENADPPTALPSVRRAPEAARDRSNVELSLAAARLRDARDRPRREHRGGARADGPRGPQLDVALRARQRAQQAGRRRDPGQRRGNALGSPSASP